MSDGARSPLRRLPDGTVKQVGPLTGTQVWTVPGRANRPLAADREPPRPLAPGEHDRMCAFCVDRYLDTTPEKVRLVAPGFAELRRVPADELGDTVAEFRRFGNLFEIVSAEYWRENHGFRQPSRIVEWAQRYLASPVGRAHLERLAAIGAEASGVEVSLEEAALDLLLESGRAVASWKRAPLKRRRRVLSSGEKPPASSVRKNAARPSSTTSRAPR